MLEGLERRYLLAATISLVKGQLIVIGTNAADNIEITQSGGNTTVNDGGTVTTLTRPVSHIVLQGKSGNDRLVVNDSILVDANIDGGDGNDFLRGGGGPDRLSGGRGNDVLNGGLGTDILVGAEGVDTASYADRTTGVVADLDGVADDGAPGENDFIKIDIENLEGSGFDDVLTGNDGVNVIWGLGGNDLIDARGGNDNAFGGDGDDMLEGGAGVDLLEGGDGADTLTNTDPAPLISAAPVVGPVLPPEPEVMYGGPGDDELTAGNGPAVLIGDEGDDQLNGGPANDVLDGRDGDDTCEGGDGNDVICGGLGTDNMIGGDGNDAFVNNDRNPDFIDGGEGIDFAQEEENFVDTMQGVDDRFDVTEDGQDPEPTIGGTDGIDRILGPAPIISQAGEISPLGLSGGVLTISGTSNADTIEVNQVGDLINVYRNGAFEEDYFASEVTSVIVDVGGGNDTVRLETTSGTNSLLKPSTIVGGSGSDTLRGGGGADSIFGGIGNDSCMGAGNNDTLSGGDGDDVLNGGSPQMITTDGRDVYQGGAGSGDYADYSKRQVALTLRLDGAANDGFLNPGGSPENENIPNDVEYLLGGTKNDLIVGNSLANLLSGGGGADTLKGGGGNDQLIASHTLDSLVDQVFGNSGSDYLFIQDTKQDQHSGIIGTDFFTPDGIDVVVADQL